MVKEMVKETVKKWLGLQSSLSQEPVKDAPYLLVNRHYLQSIKLEDADEYLATLKENEKREYEANASIVYNNPVFLRELRYLFTLQTQFIANESENWEQLLIGRGNVNGIGLVEDRFKLLNSRHLNNIKKNDDLDSFDL